jgi:hypothetical protein
MFSISKLFIFSFAVTRTSVAEPHHFYAAPAPAPGKIFYAAPAPTLLSRMSIFKKKTTSGPSTFFLRILCNCRDFLLWSRYVNF